MSLEVETPGFSDELDSVGEEKEGPLFIGAPKNIREISVP